MEYIGEHLLPGKLGHFAVIFGFVASLLAVAAFTFATNRRDTDEYHGFRKIGRIAFVLHGLSVFTIIAIIFYMMLNQYYEYQYVWAHVSEDLPFKYIFSAFWEGQEGSFLLWMFWHVILGFVLIK
ncbi:MAG: cytochrome c-type biogenesis protein CcmF, partial [Nonlabens sp.]